MAGQVESPAPQKVAAFPHDPLAFLAQEFPRNGEAFWLDRHQLIVAEPEVARGILSNQEGLFEDHSDFFHTRNGTFGPRSVQVAMGRFFQGLLRTHLHQRRRHLSDFLRQELPRRSEWPDAGNWLIHQQVADVLISPGSPPALGRLLREIVGRSILAGARQRHSWWSRVLFRRRVNRVLTEAVEERRNQGTEPPADLFDAVVQTAGPEASPTDLGEILLSVLFATVGSVGFTLGWCLYLLGTHPPCDARPEWVVREALRLWPIAWMLGRRPTQNQEVAGHPVTPDDLVVVCTYLVHRHPDHWDDPERFDPARWAAAEKPRANLPFGWGPHTCAAAGLTLELVGHILSVLLENDQITATAENPRPHVGPALAPPHFTLHLNQ